MSTCIDFSYRIDGKPAELAKARSLILEFQAGCPDPDGMDRELLGDEPGQLHWSGYTTASLEGLNDGLSRLTRRKATKVWFYEGCTDVWCDGYLHLFEKGEDAVVGNWKTDIGMGAAMAIVGLDKGPDIDAVDELAHCLRVAVFEGWARDSTHLIEAVIFAQSLAQGIREYPAMLASSTVRNALQRNFDQLSLLRDGLDELDAIRPSTVAEIDGLLAAIEGLEIASAVKVVDRPTHAIHQQPRL